MQIIIHKKTKKLLKIGDIVKTLLKEEAVVTNIFMDWNPIPRIEIEVDGKIKTVYPSIIYCKII